MSLLFKAWDAFGGWKCKQGSRHKKVGPDPVVDPMVPINNDALHKAINAYARHPDPFTEKEFNLALARAVYLTPARPHMPWIRRPDGVRVVPPGLGIEPVRPTIFAEDPPLLVFTDESFMHPASARNLHILYAWEVFDGVLRKPGNGLLVNTKEYPNASLTPWDCRDVRRLLGRSSKEPKSWPEGWPQPQQEPPVGGYQEVAGT